MTATAQPAPHFDVCIEQHSLSETLALHLFPGFLLTVFYYFLGAPAAARLGWSTMQALNLGILFVVVPVELGVMLYLGRAHSGRFSLRGILFYRQPAPTSRTAAIAMAGAVWAVLVLALLGGLHTWILHTFFSWVPDYLLPSWNAPGQPQSARMVAILQALVLSGVVGPVVEEMYFRGFLLPRLSRFGVWSVVLHTGLFSIYPLWTPWFAITRFLIALPMVYAVWLTRNIRIGIWFHCLTSTWSVLVVLLAGFISPA